MDLAYQVAPSVVDGARRLAALMDEADGFCRSGQLMTPPRTPVARRFAAWHLDRVAGRPAARWRGPLEAG